MKDSILAKHIVEGLIHNLNNPLNIILGFAQVLKKKDPEDKNVNRIYSAGIEINRQLKELSSHLYARSFATKSNVDLGAWLSGELSFLDHHLAIKNSVKFEREDLCDDIEVISSELALSLWYEDKIQKILREYGRAAIKTGVCHFTDKKGIYIKLDVPVEAKLKESLLLEGEHSLILPEDYNLKSYWDEGLDALCGVVI